MKQWDAEQYANSNSNIVSQSVVYLYMLYHTEKWPDAGVDLK